MNDDIRKAKRQKRMAERIWKKSGLTVHKEIYVATRNTLNSLITSSKRDHLQQCVSDSTQEQGTLFKCVNGLFGNKKSTVLPKHDCAKDLCNKMASFFRDKIQHIHNSLAEVQSDTFQLDADEEFQSSDLCFEDFSPVTEEELDKIIKQCANKSCSLDPIPTQLVKECLDFLLPFFTRLTNMSFSTAYVPGPFKLAAVTPILKKPNLNAELLQNFRPISNLPFLSKVLEKVATRQMLQHKDLHNLREKNQSAYRKFHSTETALLRIQHDLLLSLDNKQCVFMVMLDLSAAFDTVNHQKLLDRLFTTYGFRGNAHKWLTSYLTDRKQFVTIRGERSQEQLKTCDVPQGSIMGPNLYEDYSAGPIGAIFRKHNVPFHIYADDTQSYLAFGIDEEKISLDRLEACLTEIRQWMAANWLKLNDSKTEFIIFGSKNNLSQISTQKVTVGDEEIGMSDSVRSIGAVLDNTLGLDKQIAATCKTAWYHLHEISKIRKFLTIDQAKTVIHAYVTCRLDQNNSLLVGLPKKKLAKLQMIQNAAARLIFGLKKRDHVTPTLKQLHWLPVNQRIIFKTLLLVYKSLHGQGPEYLKELLMPYIPPRTLRSASENRLCVPSCHYVDTQKRAFGIRGPSEWNRLPGEIKSSSNVKTFKQSLKTHLFKLAYQ